MKRNIKMVKALQAERYTKEHIKNILNRMEQ